MDRTAVFKKIVPHLSRYKPIPAPGELDAVQWQDDSSAEISKKLLRIVRQNVYCSYN
jgi:hypothetical protein